MEPQIYRRETRMQVIGDDDEAVEFNEEREEEEYIYAPQRNRSIGSETLTLNFPHDDRNLGQNYAPSIQNDRSNQSYTQSDRSDIQAEIRIHKNRKIYELDESSESVTESISEKSSTRRPKKAPPRQPLVTRHIIRRELSDDEQSRRHRTPNSQMSVDYSAQDFRQSRAVIDAAAKHENVRVKKIGDTTIVTEHRDPYSFYWQLDQARRVEPDPPRRTPLTDYVIEEEEVPHETAIISPESHDSGVNVESQYSKPIKEEVRQLPAGWEKHEDPSGFSYYWHVDSGTIQREEPRISQRPDFPVTPPSPPIYEKAVINPPQQIPIPQPSPQPPAQPIIEEHAFKQITTKREVQTNDEEEGNLNFLDEDRKPVRFMVRSLGWMEIPEEELTAERSSRTVNNAIVELSTNAKENTPKWGNGKELIMELNDNELVLIDPESLRSVHSERIQQIRIWGVGRDNGRDFAYVARDTKDRGSRRFLCHVFRCDTPARAIANTLRDICKRIMENRRPQTATPVSEKSERRLVREQLVTPIDEVRKIVRCNFVGVTQVPRATGIDILNDAVNRLVTQVKPEKWVLVDITVALSTITITEVGGGEIAQCRVRFLSFLGIGQDVKHCAFIMRTSLENFMCYVFHVETSAAPLAKTIEGACKLRYQKLLDAHMNNRSHSANSHRVRYADY